MRFMGRYNYFLNEMGLAVLMPNVRGSKGYGKTYLDLDNGFKRKDSVKDGGAFLTWAATHPRLDAKRIAVSGGSYGGYMSLAIAVDYSPLIRGAIDELDSAVLPYSPSSDHRAIRATLQLR